MAFLLPILQGLLTTYNITAVLIVVVVCLVTLRLVRRGRNLPPAVPAWPVVGNLPSLAKNAHLQLTAWRETYGDVFRVKMGFQDAVVLGGNDAIREALVRQAEHFSSRPDLFLIRHAGIQHGILMAPYDEQWKRLRRFTMSTLRSFGMGRDIMEERVMTECHHFCAALEEKADHPFDLTDLLHNAVSNIICTMALGKRFEYGDPTFLRLMAGMERGTELFVKAHVLNIYPMLRFFPGFRNLYKEWINVTVEGQTVHNYMINLAEEQTEETKDTAADNIIDAFTRHAELNPGSLLDESLPHLLTDLFGAGTKTTANTLRWGLLYLMTNPDIQTKVQAELDEVVGRDRPPALSDKASLPYTEATILEIQRIRAVVPLAVPHCTTSDTTVKGYDIPAGTDVIINLWSAHMDPSRWDNPEHFDPNRFLEDNGQVQTHDSLMPFSTGRRICLGEQLAKQELFLFLTTMLQHFTFKLPEAAEPSFEGIFGSSLRPESYELIATRRPKV